MNINRTLIPFISWNEENSFRKGTREDIVLHNTSSDGPKSVLDDKATERRKCLFELSFPLGSPGISNSWKICWTISSFSKTWRQASLVPPNWGSAYHGWTRKVRNFHENAYLSRISPVEALYHYEWDSEISTSYWILKLENSWFLSLDGWGMEQDPILWKGWLKVGTWAPQFFALIDIDSLRFGSSTNRNWRRAKHVHTKAADYFNTRVINRWGDARW